MTRRQDFEIGGTRIAPGARGIVDLPVSVMSDHTEVTMSVEVIHGRKPGPVVFVSAGVHGDELIGMEIVRRLLRSKALRALRGTLLVVPIVNSFGFLTRSRYLPDRRDLNRCFPGSRGGSLAARLAHLFMTEVVRRSDLGIDLHSAAVHRTNYPQIRITPGQPGLDDLAQVFGAPVILKAPLRDGSLRHAAMEDGVDMLLYEAGEGLRFDEYAVRVGVAGILRVMQRLEMLPARRVAAAKRAPVLCRSSHWLRAPAGGLFRAYVAEGTVVAEGEVLGAVSDPFGQADREIVADGAGVIIGRAVMPVVNEGDAVFHLAEVARPKTAETTFGDLTDQLEREPLFDEDEII